MSASLPPNLGLDLIRCGEAAALAAGHWMGLANPDEADRAATDAMLSVLSGVNLAGRVVVGKEGRRGQEAGLAGGQIVGNGSGPEADVILDPIDGRTPLALGHPGALAAIAAAPRGAMWCPQPAAYMEKIIVDAQVAAALVPECLDAPAAWTLALVARAKDKRVRDLVVFVLARFRHAELVREIRSAGARVLERLDGEISGALLAATGEKGVDLMMGVGGIPEGLAVACAVKALGGAMLGRLAPQDEAEAAAVREAGLDRHRILTQAELVTSQNVLFVATGITDGPLLSGVQYERGRARSNSLLLRGEGRTRRLLYSEHLLDE
ncbi:MAG: fructose-bisphosphatase class II [Chloroflexi bacterium]|nr:fructose-bisphosphatase class II [Chloroflexota bacterium]